MLKAAIEFGKNKLGTPVVIGNEKRVKETLKNIGLEENFKIEIVNSTNKEKGKNIQNICTKNFKEQGSLKEM